MDANQLGRWTRFAAKGGIGKCVAIQDCLAEEADDLMFMTDDEITVLMQLPGEDDMYLGYCEGVVGRFRGVDVKFQGRLKKPVMAKRSSTASTSRPSSRPSSSLSTATHGGRESTLPRNSPSMPTTVIPASSSKPPSRASHHKRTPSNSTNYSVTLDSTHTNSVKPEKPPSASPMPITVPLPERESSPAPLARTHARNASQASASTASVYSAKMSFDDDSPDAPSDHPRVDSPADLDDSLSADTSHTAEPPHSDAPAPIIQAKPLLELENEPVSSSFMSSEPSARLSQLSAISDGEVGIGLNFLQNLIDGDDSDSDDEFDGRKSLHSNTRSPDPNGTQDMSISSDSTVEQHQSDDDYQEDMSLEFPVPPDAPSRNSLPGTDSEYGGEEWEGASDIYDNYRYSRMSMASKMSRFSKGSAFSLGVPPPVPTEGRPSMDSVRPLRERLESSATASSVESALKRVPAPLTFSSEITSSRKNSQDGQKEENSTTSPLLHTSFGSPLSSPTPVATGGFLPSAAGVASALRQKLEIERSETPPQVQSAEAKGLGMLGLPAEGRARLSTQPIVMEDDESIPPVSPPANQSFNTMSSMSPDQSSSPLAGDDTRSSSLKSSSYINEKMAMESSLVVANPNPPPPYSPDASSSQVSSLSPPRPQQPQSHPVGVPIPRPRPANANASSASRTSLFMPHPHAPKPAASPAGPMYGRPPSVDAAALLAAGPPPDSAVQTIKAALTIRYDGSPGSRRPTIYGVTDVDLSTAMGPVPIWFSLDPPNNIPANRNKSPAVSRQGTPAPLESPPQEELDATRKVIPRANFFPKAKTARPRSRSFSGFDSQIAEIELPQERSFDDHSKRDELPPVQTLTKRSKSASAMVAAPANTAPAQRASVSHTPPTSRSVVDRKPSPLSLSQNNLVVPEKGPAPPKSPTAVRPSPLAMPPLVATPPRSPLSPTMGNMSPSSTSPTRPLNIMPRKTLDRMMSPPPNEPPSSPLAASRSFSLSESPPQVSRSETLPNPAPPPSSSPPSSFIRRSRSSLSLRHSRSQSKSSLQGRRSGETEVPQNPDSTTNAVTSPSLGRTGSLRSKLSLPTLRIRNERPSQEGPRSPTLSLSTSEQEQRTVQVKDAEFELVVPSGMSGPLSPVPPSATDDVFSLPPPSPINPDGSLRTGAGSPAFSVTSSTSTGTRTRVPPAAAPQNVSSPAKPPPSPGTAEAYRKRELLWISTISSIPASQSRKSKKVRRLLQDGVPSSVRYLVWAYLTDSKAKRIDGLYARLGKRERVAALGNIERDVARFVQNHPQVQESSLVNLLQAYLTMVPDVQYTPGLVAVAGLILLQSPEEDAFWTFISLMDSHIRPYFSANPIQLEVDAALVAKCLEAVEPALAKKLFVDLAIPPAAVCRPWFTSLFVDMLPPEHLRRVWDIFLFEGVVFLFRASLAVIISCKPALFEATSAHAVTNILLNPPTSLLPTQPDTYLEVAFSVKMKDDDIRKQRNKMEAQVKRQTQSRGIDLSRPSISLPRS